MNIPAKKRDVMKKHPLALNRWIPVAIVFLLLSTVANAQDEWENLSTRERLRIGEQEKREAENDAEFQKLMREGHSLFKDKHYLKAIRKYEEAQEQRPYNVYPKVIIADIELSMKDTLAILRENERLENLRNNPPPPPEAEEESTEEYKPELTETKQETIDRLSDWEREERRKREMQRERERQREEEPSSVPTSGEVPQMSTEEYQAELGRTYPQGVTETVEKEGNKTITTRIVVKDQKGNSYRKVAHDWGGVFYFKNGKAVTQRVWDEETTR
ncbi:MAG TPA: hypothetical protein VKY29_06865 [Cryomorphaceae bacterium]|nr:hypothetical protein [Cryomorphaceae bacterium]